MGPEHGFFMSKKIVLILTAIAFSCSMLCAEEANDTKKQEEENKHLITRKIADLNLAAFDWREDEWSTHSMTEYIQRMEKEVFEPKPRRKRQTAFKLFEEIEKKQKNDGQKLVDNSRIWQDLELYCGRKKPVSSVVNAIDRTTTEIGKISFYLLLAQPTIDKSLLQQRQDIIRFFKENVVICDAVQKSLTAFAASETILLRFWDQDHLRHAIERNTFEKSPLTFLDESDSALLAKSIWDHQERASFLIFTSLAAAALISYGTLRIFNIIDMPKWLSDYAHDNKGYAGPVFAFFWDKITNRWIQGIISLAAGFWCASRLKDNFDWSYGNVLLDRLVHKMMINIAQNLISMQALYTTVKATPELADFDEFKPLIELFDKQLPENEHLREFFDLLNDEGTFEGEPSFFAHKGFILRSYLLMQELKKLLEPALACVARIDTYHGLAKLMNENATTRFCFPVYAQANKPFTTIDEFWHPLIPTNKVVTNTISLGTDNQRPNTIITGPNEGGKSTVLKSITLCLLMAQTLGVAPAKAMTLTPFASIATYLNITDDIGSGNSLFKAEVLQAQQLIDRVKNAQSHEFNFAVFDEVFNGTSPVEGSAAAYSVAKHLATYANSIYLIATHFPLLTQLELLTDTVSNYKVSVIQQPDGSITYPYKLEHGISDQHVALDILRNQGFASTIIDDAQSVTRCIEHDRSYNPDLVAAA